MYRRFGKRFLDVALTTLSLPVVLPLLAGIAVLVRLSLGRPVFFCQRRPGLHGRPFTIYKFRTMTDARDSKGNLLPDAERLPSFGRLLRKTSLDELPELINVLKGDMSLVGPRPLLMEYLPYYTQREMTRHCVRPGITGLAQINGRNYLPWDERLELDSTYIETLSLSLDLRILFQTCFQVLVRSGVAEVPGSVSQKLSTIRSLPSR